MVEDVWSLLLIVRCLILSIIITERLNEDLIFTVSFLLVYRVDNKIHVLKIK